MINNYTTTNNTSKVAQASALNSAISPTGNIEQNQKDFNQVYHTYLLADTLVTAVQLNALKNLAALCPFTDGTNVYQARALLRHYDTTEYFNSCEFNIPNIGAGSRIRSSNTALNLSYNALTTKIFPNPATTEITITTEMEGAVLMIFNIVGQLIIETNLTSETRLNISELKNGTYFYKVMKEREVIKTDKLIINK